MVMTPGEEVVPELVERVDGIVLAGGGGNARRMFRREVGAPTLEAVNPERYRFECRLIRESVARGIPLLGICRGMQMLSEALGGGVIRDIASEVPHALQHYQRAPSWCATHGISIAPESKLADIVGMASAEVNSFHRQAVATPGSGMRVCASAPDGIVEAVESMSGFVLGVQFHPEMMVAKEARWLRIFEALVAAARRGGGL